MDRSLDISGSLAIFLDITGELTINPIIIIIKYENIWYKHWQTFIGDGLLIGFTMFTSWHPSPGQKLPRASRRLLAEDVASAKRITSRPKMTKNHQKIDGCSMDVPWISVGFFNGFPWIVYGISMDCWWNVYGFSPASPAAAASDEAQRHWTRLLSAVVVSTWASSGSQKISLPTIEFHRKHWFSILSIGSES